MADGGAWTASPMTAAASPAQPLPSTWEPGLFHWFFVVISGPWCQGSGVRHAAAVHTWGLVGPSETDTGGGFPDMNKLRL